MHRKKPAHNSYLEILKTSSIIGIAHGLGYVVGLLRIKVAAVMLGPSGIGLIGFYQSVLNFISTISSLGIGSSGVREIALAFSCGDERRIARATIVLRRACWVTGVLGWLMAIALAFPLSQWSFGSDERALAIAILGLTILLGSIGGGQSAILQGMRRIADIARIQIISMILNTTITVVLYYLLREEGILPSIIITAGISLFVSWWFTRTVKIEKINIGFMDAIEDSRKLISLGLALMWSGILTTGLDIATKTLITKEQGISAAGQYQAAWALSAMFASFILAAMSADYYPRLTNVITRREEAVKIVNEQTEVGILLSLPGILGTLIFAPWILRIFYSAEFEVAGDMLPYFVIGVFGRVLAWPMGYIQLAIGAGKWYAFTETFTVVVWYLLIYIFLNLYGMVGVSYAFAVTYLIYTTTMLVVSFKLIEFKWSNGVMRLVAVAMFLMIPSYFLRNMYGVWILIFGIPVILLGAIYSIIGIGKRIGRLGYIYRFMRGSGRMIRMVKVISVIA